MNEAVQAAFPTPNSVIKPYKEYVCGFLFNRMALNAKTGMVALIHKTKPAWQAGKHNGIGGHIEPGETPLQAMRREFREEAGIIIMDWEQFARIEGEGYTCYFFRAFSYDATLVKTAAPDEGEVALHPTDALPPTMLTNVRWLIQMALHEESGHGIPYRIREGSQMKRKG